MPRVKKDPVPATPVTPPVSATPTESVTPATPATPVVPDSSPKTRTPQPPEGDVKVKHVKTGKTFTVSRAYYEANKGKLDVVS